MTILTLALQAVIVVGGTDGAPTLAGAIAAANAGDTLRVRAGLYAEHVVVDRSVVILADSGAVLDGEGRGTVLTLRAAATVRGLTVRGSGAVQSAEDAGILVENADGVVLEDNRLEDVLFGIYVKESTDPVIARNVIRGKDRPIPLRGDAIRLWSSRRGRIVDNDVAGARDLVIWFSDSAVATGNYVRDGRYGIHYMYSNHSRFSQNRFERNHVGGFLMYSSDIEFTDNVFASGQGTTGRGLGFKDTDRIVARGNTLVRNAVGISIDNSPSAQGVRNIFRDNIIAFNDVGVELLPSVHDNDFVDNAFVDNVTAARVTGGGRALANHWDGNYWTEYAGFDADGDGFGDTPFQFERLANDLFAKHEALSFFALSPATATLNSFSRVLPLLAPMPVVIDSHPRLTAPSTDPAPGAPVAAVVWFAAAVVASGLVGRTVRPRRAS